MVDCCDATCGCTTEHLLAMAAQYRAELEALESQVSEPVARAPIEELLDAFRLQGAKRNLQSVYDELQNRGVGFSD